MLTGSGPVATVEAPGVVGGRYRTRATIELDILPSPKAASACLCCLYLWSGVGQRTWLTVIPKLDTSTMSPGFATTGFMSRAIPSGQFPSDRYPRPAAKSPCTGRLRTELDERRAENLSFLCEGQAAGMWKHLFVCRWRARIEEWSGERDGGDPTPRRIERRLTFWTPSKQASYCPF